MTDGAPDFDANKVAACEAAVEAFRRGEIAKKEAFLRILGTIELERVFTSADVRDQHRDACLTFFQQLEEVENICKNRPY